MNHEGPEFIGDEGPQVFWRGVDLLDQLLAPVDERDQVLEVVTPKEVPVAA